MYRADPLERLLSHSPPSIKSERWIPVATITVLTITIVTTGLSVVDPAILHLLWRNPRALAAGELWRLFTPLFVQPDEWWQVLVIFVGILVFGAFTERLFGTARWLVLYFGSGLVGEFAGYAWQPYDAGASIAVAGLMGSICVWMLWNGDAIPWRFRFWAPVWLLFGAFLTATADIHGPALLAGACLATVFLWRDDAPVVPWFGG